jgi:putative ABC transport system ATP-binding protein
MPPLIEVVGLAKSFQIAGRTLVILRDLHLEVERGDFLAVTGTSGCGKTTLLHILGGLETPTAGSYRFAGCEVARLDDEGRSRLRGGSIGFVFQSFQLLPQLDVLENVALPFLYSQVEVPDADDRSADALAAVGLGHRLTHRPPQLSGGELQRVAIARALVVHPELILADEPTGNLDSETGRGILELLARLNESGVTIVMVTHDQEIARQAGRRAQMRDGCLACA